MRNRQKIAKKISNRLTLKKINVDSKNRLCYNKVWAENKKLKGRAKMLVYHGSKELFTEFSYSRIGTNGTTEGQGFYFTDNLQVAKSYSEKDGYVYEVDFVGKKSLNSDKIAMKRSEV